MLLPFWDTGKGQIMWVLLAISLLSLRFNRLIAVLILACSCVWGYINDVIQPVGAGFIIALAALALVSTRLQRRPTLRIAVEIIALLAAVALTMHWIPGFNNPRIVENSVLGPRSIPFGFSFNFDKALVPFILMIALPSLFVSAPPVRVARWCWGALILCVPGILLIAMGAAGLKLELHWPTWLPAFVLANLFFVSLAEEALFRGYLQQRLSLMMPPVVALCLTSILFGALHAAGGPLLMLFAGISGLVYGLAWMWSGRLWVSTLFHFGLNMCHLLLFTYPALRPAIS